MTAFRIAGLACALGVANVFAQEADPAVARNLAATCAACHGTNGASVTALPSLAGMSREEMVAKLREYKAGTRQGTLMPQLAKGYADDQIELAARWFAAQPPPRR